ncbi:hypothetical protein, partial [Sulfitobacter geojensis]
MKTTLTFTLTACILSGCQTTTDPSQGGFLNGVSSINSGAYEQRSATLDQQEAAERARQQQLRRELGQLQGEYASLQRTIRQQRARIAANKLPVSSSLNARANSSLKPAPSSGDADA